MAINSTAGVNWGVRGCCRGSCTGILFLLQRNEQDVGLGLQLGGGGGGGGGRVGGRGGIYKGRECACMVYLYKNIV